MAAVSSWRRAFAVVAVVLVLRGGARAATFTISNNCGYTVWPGLLSSAGSAALPTTGFALAPGESRAVAAPAGWSGRLWGRTLCATGAGAFACATGDCGSGDVQCGGGGAAPPATLAEFTLDGSGGLDFFDVSLVDGYNLPMVITPSSSSAAAAGATGGKCAATGCAAELNAACPAELRAEGGTACRSACEAFGAAQYCCSGDYGSPAACRPSAYSEFFKSACPRAYSYAYDDATSTFTCAAGATDYAVTFCPAAASPSVKSTGPNQNNPQAAGVPRISNTTMVYFGGDSAAAAAASLAGANFLTAVAATAVALAALLH
ncbi:hypothetical protein ACP4OV_003420 [Aristida adscensionis]